jgi:acylphosphatase
VTRVCAHVLVTGYVQGVFFRHTAARLARSAGLEGWIKNLPDGRVEAVIQGERDSVEDLVRWCGQGPAHASVERIDVEWEAVSTGISGFQVL